MKTARKNKYTLDTTGQAWIYQDGFADEESTNGSKNNCKRGN